MARSSTERSLRRLGVRRLSPEGDSSFADHVVAEEPLEIRIAGEPLAVTMRTPGHDAELALGFLFAEGIVGAASDAGSAAHCGKIDDPGYGNVLDVHPAPETTFDIDRRAASRRGTVTTAACGVCGRTTIDDLFERVSPVSDDTPFERQVVAGLTSALRRAQPCFDKTGGLHAAAIARPDGSLRVVREDVGRHNAVDKCLGRLLLDGDLPVAGAALVVSGRSSFEIVQKAAVANIGLVVSVSAPSSLAVAIAERARITLVGFARDSAFNVYSHPDRIG